MRIVISEFISLDGVIQAPGGPQEDTDGGFAHGGWSLPFFDPEIMGAAIGAGFASVEALLFGRRTFNGMAAAWPDRAGDPFADQMNAIKKYVVSSTLTPDAITWENAELIPADGALDAIRALRARDGGDLSIMGSATLSRSLIEADLVDELNLMIEPVSLGGGKRLFPDDGSARVFELVSTTLASTGVQICKFRPTGAPLVTGHSDELYENGREPVTPA
ncbi:MAG: ribG9 [Ilumatobacteraceae bacterium]|nr:ribG9 [Ilumatobacteraceae bacterium]